MKLNQKGLTVIELLIALSLLTVVLGIGYNFLNLEYKTFHDGETQFIIQREVRMAASFITDEVRQANEVKIYANVNDPEIVLPVPINSDYNYIIMEDVTVGSETKHRIKHYNKDGSSFETDPLINKLLFTKDNSSNMLKFEIEALDNGKDYHINSQVMPIKSTFLGNSSGTVIRYKKAQRVATPVANPGPGAVSLGTKVEITTSTPGADIYYTTDDTDPSAASTKYTGPITIDKEMTVKVIAVKQGMADSAILTATYTIAGYIPVTAVKLNKDTLDLPVPGGQETLTATISPSNASNKAVSWSSSNNSVATVDNNGIVTAVSVGSATITVMSLDNNAIKDTCQVTVTAHEPTDPIVPGTWGLPPEDTWLPDKWTVDTDQGEIYKDTGNGHSHYIFYKYKFTDFNYVSYFTITKGSGNNKFLTTGITFGDNASGLYDNKFYIEGGDTLYYNGTPLPGGDVSLEFNKKYYFQAVKSGTEVTLNFGSVNGNNKINSPLKTYRVYVDLVPDYVGLYDGSTGNYNIVYTFPETVGGK